jgi:hypothetical protein
MEARRLGKAVSGWGFSGAPHAETSVEKLLHEIRTSVRGDGERLTDALAFSAQVLLQSFSPSRAQREEEEIAHIDLQLDIGRIHDPHANASREV